MPLPKKILIEVYDQGTLTLPEACRDARLYEVRPRDGGGLEFTPPHAIDASQAWFWLDCWQAMEREADAAIASRRVRRFNSGDDLLEELENL